GEEVASRRTAAARQCEVGVGAGMRLPLPAKAGRGRDRTRGPVIQFSNSQASAFPRRDLRPGFANLAPEKAEGAGNAGCTTHPLPCVQNKKDARRPTQVRRNHTALPAQWAYGCSVISPANQLFCHRRCADRCAACPLHWRDRTTRLDRTRSRRTSCGRCASIATRLTSGDEWPSRPPCRGGLASLNHKFCVSERGIFLRGDLDSSGETPFRFSEVARRSKQAERAGGPELRGSPRLFQTVAAQSQHNRSDRLRVPHLGDSAMKHLASVVLIGSAL